MALGIASESTPSVGLTTAVVSGFLISALGGSKVAIGGPTAAFIPIVVGIAHEYGPEKLILCTVISGGMLIAMGLAGLGSAVKLVPRPVTTGFTAGIATFILSTQIKDALGFGITGQLPPEASVIPSPFLEKLIFFGTNLEYAHIPSLALAVSGVLLIKAYPPAFAKVVPPQIVAVVVGSAVLGAAGSLFGESFGIETIGSHFGADAIPKTLPAPSFPSGLADLLVHPDELSDLLKPSFTIALLAAIESLLCARVSDGFIGDRHRPNTELIAQGIANIASATFGGLPATGALARTAANVRAGGKSPISGMVHAVTVLGFILVAAPAAAYIPLPTLSAVLIVVGLNMVSINLPSNLSSPLLSE
jgi:SulP family sulfate permease